MKALKIELVNAQRMQWLHAETFSAPGYKELNKIKPGYFVKVCIDGDEESEAPGERFWCEVKSVNRLERTIVGAVNNHLIYFDYPVDTLLVIDFDEVYDILEPQPQTK